MGTEKKVKKKAVKGRQDIGMLERIRIEPSAREGKRWM